MDEFERRIGRAALGNMPASGTEIIKELGEEHMRTGSPIVYTSADSVFQIAAHEEVIPLPELYRICEIAREILRGPHEVGRVIARPFIGAPGAFTRTANRHDYAVPPPARHAARRAGRSAACRCPAWARSSTSSWGAASARSGKTKNNADGMAKILEAMAASCDSGLIFVNLVDFDMLYGHRNDVEGYAAALEAVRPLAAALLEAACAPDDLLILTADHGCDPTTPSTDHSREYVPLLAYGPRARARREPGHARHPGRHRADGGREFRHANSTTEPASYR